MNNIQYGRSEPRLFTAPLRELSPETSYGFDVIAFADKVLEEPLDPWQQWLVIHAGELLEDGRPRFRKLLILVARQNGKTHLLRTLATYWLFIERQKLILGISHNLSRAKEPWTQVGYTAKSIPDLNQNLDRIFLRTGEEAIVTTWGGRYMLSAANSGASRGLSVNRLIVDEVREQHTLDAYSAAVYTMQAQPGAQAFFISNQGDIRSVVIDKLRDEALSGENERTGLFEWSAPDDCELDDVEALAMANPNMGYRIDPDDLIRDARANKLATDEVQASFRTEVLCQRVNLLNPAVNAAAWSRSLLPGLLPESVAVCLDVSPDREHVTVVAAGILSDGSARVERVGAYSGATAVDDCRRELPGLVAKVKPRVFGWFPSGPAAAMAADLEKKRGQRIPWPPSGVKLEEIRGGLPAVCMGFSEFVVAGKVVHSGDQLLDEHIGQAEKRNRGDGTWVFSRQKGSKHCDAAYATAGAVHLARLLTPRSDDLNLITL